MRWKDGRRSENIEDRRGSGGARVAAGGGLAALVIAVVVMFLGGDPRQVMQMLGQGGAPQQQAAGPPDPQEEQLKDFVSVVLADTEDVWTEQFAAMGKTYNKPTLVLFRGRVESACGLANAAVGPFYCPADQKVYIDLSFYEDLRKQLQAPGDFAQAYVIAHEIGHHVQNLLGISDRVHAQKSRLSEREYNDLSVRLELQADFLAGVWAHHADRARNILERGDIAEAVRAAGAIGDDRLQMQSQGFVRPDSFTHGTSEQRVRWFNRGLETGDIRQGDTFAARDL